MLKNMQFPYSKKNTCVKHAVDVGNPDEIDIDSTTDSDDEPKPDQQKSSKLPQRMGSTSGKSSDRSFADFGIGKLQFHPLVQRLWHLPPQFNILSSPTFLDVSVHLPEFFCVHTDSHNYNNSARTMMYELSSGRVQGNADNSIVSASELAQFLCQRYNVQHISQLGLLIAEQALPTLVHAYRRYALHTFLCTGCMGMVCSPAEIFANLLPFGHFGMYIADYVRGTALTT